MIGLDTNVLVRFIVQDDPSQAAIANKLISGLTRENQGFISVIVLVELVWVLEASYKASKQQILEVLQKILLIETFQVQFSELVHRSLRIFRDNSFDFADILISIVNRYSSCAHTVTFDRAAARIDGMQYLT